MKSILREITMYLVYAIVVSMIGYFSRDMSAFLFTRNIGELFTVNMRERDLPKIEVNYTYKCNETLVLDKKKYFGNCSGITNDTEWNAKLFNVTKMEDYDKRTTYKKVCFLLLVKFDS